MAKGTTLRERVAALEVSVINLKSSIDDLRDSNRSNFKRIYTKLDNLESHVNQILGAIDSMSNHSSLSNKTKAAVSVATITGVTSIIVTLLQVLPTLIH